MRKKLFENIFFLEKSPVQPLAMATARQATKPMMMAMAQWATATTTNNDDNGKVAREYDDDNGNRH